MESAYTRFKLQNRPDDRKIRCDLVYSERLDRGTPRGCYLRCALYNVFERVRALAAGAAVAPLSESERDVYDAGLVGVLGELHDEIDRALLRADG